MKTHKLPSLSVFFPAYNEEKNIQNTVEKALVYIPTIAEKWEIIVVNDGSKDRTGEIAHEIAKRHKGVRVIDHKVNRGYGASLKSGLYSSKYSWIMFTDSDGQFDIREAINFIDTQEETQADIVIGFYKQRKVPIFRKINSKAWEFVVFVIFGLKVRDIDCGFKMISKKVVDTIPALESERGAFISSEFLIKAKKSKFKIIEIPVTHYPRLAGKGTGADLKVIVKSFIDLFKLWQKLR